MNEIVQLEIPLDAPETKSGDAVFECGTVATQLVDRLRLSRDEAIIAAGLPVSTSGKPLPNQVLRSALFAVAQKVFRREVRVASIEGVDVFIARGYRPTQAHLDVWEHCIHLAADQGTGKRISFSAYSFLKAIDRSSSGGNDRKWLSDTLLDLAGCIVKITDGRRTYFGPLIEGGVRDEKTEEYVISINPKLAVLFSGGAWTAMDFGQRKALRRHPLAQWLHAFYSTHGEPYRYKVETIRNLCGSETEDLWKFRQMLRRALREVSAVSGWSCEIDENDCIEISKIKHIPCQSDTGIAGRVEKPELSTG